MTMDTAGKAVLFSGVTVLISLTRGDARPEPRVSLDEPRDHARRHLRARRDADAAAGRARQARPEGRQARAAVGALRRAPLGRGSPPGASGCGATRSRYGALALAVLVALAFPVTQLKTAMPSIKVVPTGDSSRVGYQQVQAAIGPGATGPLQIVAPAGRAAQVARIARRDPGIARAAAGPDRAAATRWSRRSPSRTPPTRPSARRSTGCAPTLPAGALVGGAVAENHDLQTALSAKTPLVIGVVLGLGFLLLLVALQAPLLAAVGVLTNLLATGAAFGVAKWIFQDGALHSLLGFQSQGFLDAWGPVFFFAMIFAISMDYTVFLLSSAKEHWDRTHDPKEAMVGGVAHSGRVIFAAGAVMVAVFFTFALSGPLPPKEMGIILGVAVLLDAALVRLLLLPVLLRLMGRWAWYLPRWAHRVLPHVTFGHA